MKIIKKFTTSFILILFVGVSLNLFAQPGGTPTERKQGNHPIGNRSPMTEEQMKQYLAYKHQHKVRTGDTYTVTGSVIDSTTNAPLGYLNIAVLDASDSAFFKGATTNEQGVFSINGIYAGKYLLRVTYIGYQNRMIPFEVLQNTSMGVIKLKPGSQFMKEVKIVADRPLYAMDGEKTIYNVEDDPSIQTGTTTDALQNAPGVEVDIEGNITLRGVSSVEIWINDKPSKLNEENLKTYLETLPANAISRIETITNPSSKYATDAEAVINIITSAHIHKNHFISFGANASTQPKITPWVSYMWANKKLSINAYLSPYFRDRENESFNNAITRVDNAAGDGYDTVLLEKSENNSANKMRMTFASVDLSYEIDSMTTMSAWLSAHFNGTTDFSGSSIMRNDYLSGQMLQYGDTTDLTKLNIFSNFGADITHKFDKFGHNIRFGIDGKINNKNEDTWYDRIYTPFSTDSYHKHYENIAKGYNIGAELRYNRPYSLDGEISIGWKYNHDYDNYVFNRSFVGDDGEFLYIDTLRQYNTKEFQDKMNADINWTHHWGGFTLSAGIGAGWEREQFDLNNYYFPDDSVYNFFTVNPSIHMSYRTKSMHNFKLNYSMKSKTPNADNLTTFRRYEEDSYSTGNPNLQNYYIHNAEAGWTKFFKRFGSVGIDLYARYSANDIDKLTDSEYDEYLDRWVKYTTPFNMGSSHRYGASANVTYRPSGFVNIRLYANVYNYGYNMEYNNGDHLMSINEDKWSWSTRLNVWAKLFNRLQVTLSGNYTSPSIGLLSEKKATYRLNLGLKSDFFKRRMTAYINVQDIFNWGKKYGGGSITTNPYYLSESSTYVMNGRYIAAGLTFRFGKMELEKQAKTTMPMPEDI